MQLTSVAHRTNSRTLGYRRQQPLPIITAYSSSGDPHRHPQAHLRSYHGLPPERKNSHGREAKRRSNPGLPLFRFAPHRLTKKKH